VAIVIGLARYLPRYAERLGLREGEADDGGSKVMEA
jgi:hypothetical protein